MHKVTVKSCAKFVDQTDCTPPKCDELSEYTDSAHTEVGNLSSRYMCMTDAGTTQDNFIPPAPPVGGLSISQDQLDRMKLVRDRTIPILMPSGKNILVNMVFKISVGHTNLDTRQIITRLENMCISKNSDGCDSKCILFTI